MPTKHDVLKLSDMRESPELIENPETQSGCYISKPKGILFVVLVLILATGVGLIVHFTSRCGCELSEDDKQTLCAEYIDKTSQTTAKATETTEAPSILPPDPTDVRLPLKVFPTHYSLELKPDFYSGDPSSFTFSGKVKIFVECAHVTNAITLHLNKLTIDGTVRLLDTGPGARAPKVQKWSKDEARQFLVIYLDASLTVGQQYIIDMEFSGQLKDDLKGLYWSSYKEGNETRYLATTQMQPTDARKTFPCFDEPGIRATYDVTIVRKRAMKSLSNMEIVREEDRGDGWVADVYSRSLKMSTYLLAFIVCDFEFREATTNSGTVIRLWTRPEAINQTVYALEKGVETIQNFETYFNISFPLPKQDMFAVPDFALRGMENWGLIIYREAALLYDPQLSSAEDKQLVAELIVHELAHQWFGNLVTPVWWDDLWLNEGFASYMEYVGMDKIEPTWDMHVQFVEKDLQHVLPIDSLSTSHPIWVPVNHPDEINEIFDKISYLKGSSIIRMMNLFLGEETFRSGLTNYLNSYAYGNANHTNLWHYLGQQATADGMTVDVSTVMSTWVLQMGYPLVSVNVHDSSATVTQSHYLTDPSKPPTDKYTSPYGYKWYIPLTYGQSTSPPTDWETPEITWMKTEQVSTTLPSLDADSKWLVVNIGEYGYYRVNYNSENWDAIIQQLLTDPTKIPARNRAQIIDDSAHLGRSGYLDQLVGLRATQYLVNETHYIPWKTASNVLSQLDDMLQYSQYYGAFNKYMLTLVTALYESVGFEYDPSTEPHLEKYKRALAWKMACQYGSQTCLNQATASLKQWIKNPENKTTIKPDMKKVIYCNAIKNGGLAEWNFMYAQYQNTNVAAEATRILWSLTCSQEPWILNRLLHYALDGSKIRLHDAIYVISDVSNNPVGRTLAWDFFRAQWPTIYKIWGSGLYAITNVIADLTDSFNTEFILEQMLEFKAQNPNMGSGTRAFDQAIESTRSNIKWMKANEDKLGRWLMNQ